MSSSQSNIRAFWERCISETMFLRGHCHVRPSLYYTESGSLVLDTRQSAPEDREAVHAVVVICDLVADDCGFDMVCSREHRDLYVWRKGGAA